MMSQRNPTIADMVVESSTGEDLQDVSLNFMRAEWFGKVSGGNKVGQISTTETDGGCKNDQKNDKQCWSFSVSDAFQEDDHVVPPYHRSSATSVHSGSNAGVCIGVLSTAECEGCQVPLDAGSSPGILHTKWSGEETSTPPSSA